MAQVLPVPASREGSYFASTHLPRSPSESSFRLDSGHDSSLSFDHTLQDASSSTEASSVTSSPLNTATDSTRRSSLHSTPPGSILLDPKHSTQHEDEDDEDNFLPLYQDIAHIPLDRFSSRSRQPSTGHEDDQYDASVSSVSESISESTPTADSDATPLDVNIVADDTFVREEPTRQVDYLSHDWREEDIWYSWRHITSRKRVYGEWSRLENASWRTWAKSKHKLKTVPPESLNWLKDCDVTWLYGPLQQAPTPRPTSDSQSTLSKNDSFLNKKTCLKKRSVSEIMLQKSLSSSSLVKQAAAVVQAQRRSPTRISAPSKSGPRLASYNEYFDTNATAPFATASNSISDSELPTPDMYEKKHIRFHNTVEQCIAVDFNTGDEDDVESSQPEYPGGCPKFSDESSEDDGIMMKARPRKPPNSPSSRRSSMSQESNGIVMLPSTTIKFHHDEPKAPPASPSNSLTDLFYSSTTRLPTSASQETLRPTHPASNFLFVSAEEDDDEDDDDAAEFAWEPSGAFGRASASSSNSPHSHTRSATPAPSNKASSDSSELSNGLRRTSSGMFIPFDSDDEEEDDQARLGSSGMFGKVVDTVNTARDIAHVIWNVGWRQ